MNIEERIQRLEALSPGVVPGTALQRVLKETSGYQWSLAIGGMHRPKSFFYGDTIEELLDAAELEMLDNI